MKPQSRVLGIDDAPFRFGDESTEVVCAALRIPSYLEGVMVGSVAVDEARFPRQGGGLWASADADTAPNRVEIEVRGGVGSVSIG